MPDVPQIDASDDLLRAGAIVAVVVGAYVLTAIIRVTLRFVTRRAVRRALAGKGVWRVRLPRPDDGNGVEQRRLQRADAAAHMMSRIFALVVAVIAVIIISHVLRVDPVVLVSSAGFIGAGIAIGGQALIKDWLTGLMVLLEDRYAVGDQVSVTIGGNEVSGTVETLSGVGLRLRLADGTTWHAGHGALESVTNRSQQLVQNHVTIEPDVWAELDETMIGRDLNAASHDLGLTDVLLLPEIAAVPLPDGTIDVTYRSTRPLNDRQRRLIEDRINHRRRTPVGPDPAAEPGPSERTDAQPAGETSGPGA